MMPTCFPSRSDSWECLRAWRQADIDAGIYGFTANIYFYEIDARLKQFVVSHANIVRHCLAIHDMVMHLEATLQQLGTD